MAAFSLPAHERGEIADVRMRRGFRGTLVVQVRYKMARPGIPMPGRPTEYQDAGLSAWRDADAENLREACALHILVSSK